MDKETIKAEIAKLQQKTELTKKERKHLKKLEKRLTRENNAKYHGVKTLMKWAAVALIAVFLIWGAWFLIKKSQVPSSSIISQNGLHWHPKLKILINGKEQEIPANIGIGAIHEELHTHDEDAKDGVVHMEMKGMVTKDEVRLGNFFKIWGKEFNQTQILDRKNGAEGSVKMFVNGKENNGFENYLMRENDNIEIRYEK